ncbi:TPA: minor capsid protein [Streptococcus agalactiae]
MDMHTKEGKSYWRKRVKKEMEAKDKKDVSLGKSMKQIHDYHFREIEKEIESFYQRYADKEAIDLKLAKKAVSDVDINAYQKKAKELVARANEMRKEGIKVTKANFTHQENIDMAVYNLKMKVNALELLQLNIDLAMQNLSEDEYKATKRFLEDGFEEELKFQSGLLGTSVSSQNDIKNLAKATINANFKGATWSENIWQRQDDLRKIVKEEVYKAVTKGDNAIKLSNKLKKEFEVSDSYARRLAITEHARVQMEVSKILIEDNGFNGFEILPEPSACSICKGIASDGPYPMEKWDTGNTAPPFHPHCRCAVVGEDIEHKKGKK